MTCDTCGVELVVGSWPWCPHFHGAFSVESVTWPGGKTFENLGPEPVTFYHRTDYQKYLRHHKLEEFVRHVPAQGSDKSPHTTSWATMDPYTMAAAEALVARCGKATKEPPKPTYVKSMEVTVTEVVETVWVPRGMFDVA